MVLNFLKKNKYNLVIMFFFLLLFFVYSFPLILDWNNAILALPGDSYASLVNIGNLQSIHFYFPYRPIHELMAIILRWPFGEIFAYNALVLFGFVFSGYSFFKIGQKITKNNFIALLLGISVLFLPYRISQMYQHFSLANVGFLGFFIYFLISTKQNFDWKTTLATCLFFILTTLDSPIYGLFAGLILLIFLIYHLIKWVITRPKVTINTKKLLTFIAIFLVSAGILAYFSRPFLKDLVANKSGRQTDVTAIRNIDELKTYSAYWGYYLLPSPENPILGTLTKKYFTAKVNLLATNLTEQIDYLGYTLIILSLFYLVYFFANFAKIKPLKKDLTFLFLLIGLTGLYLSLSHPLSIGGHIINRLQEKVFLLVPFFRVFSRFSLLLSIALVVFSSFGLAIIWQKIKNKFARALIFTLIMILILSEFLIWPKHRIQNASCKYMPPVYEYILQNDSNSLLAEYPLLSREAPEGYVYLLWQRCHKIPLVYGASTLSREENFRKTVINPADPNTIISLKKKGIKYIVIHKDIYAAAGIKKNLPEFNGGIAPVITSPNLELIASFESDDLYEIR